MNTDYKLENLKGFGPQRHSGAALQDAGAKFKGPCASPPGFGLRQPSAVFPYAAGFDIRTVAQYLLALFFLLTAPALSAQNPLAGLDNLPVWEAPFSPPTTDWLLDSTPYKAGVFRVSTNELVLANGLLTRKFRLAPNGATVALQNLVTSESILRGVKPEAILEIDGRRLEVGGLRGQPNYAFLRPEWVDKLRDNPGSLKFTGFQIGKIAERFPWKRVRHTAPDVKWPPEGVYLKMDYEMPQAQDSAQNRQVLFKETFAKPDLAWKVHISPKDTRSAFTNDGSISTPANTVVCLERPLPSDTRLVELSLDLGTDRTASWGPGLALVGKDSVLKFNVRPGGSEGNTTPQFGVVSRGNEQVMRGAFQGLDLAKPIALRLVWGSDSVLCEAGQGGAWRTVYELPAAALPAGPLSVRLGKLSRNGGLDDFGEPGDLVRLRLLQFAAYGPQQKPAAPAERKPGIVVSVHYELYDGLPCYSKWLTISNGTGQAIRLDKYSSEVLAAVEYIAEVDELSVGKTPPSLYVETEMAFGGMMAAGANRRSYRWLTDPDYGTQVNYERKTPCLLDVGPDLGPAANIAPGDTFTSFRAWIMAFDSSDRERRGLAMRHLYRTIAPWSTENPLMMHVRYADERTVTNAINQCAEVGFEMVILTFGSGFDLERENPATLATARKYADYAHSKGIEIGSYSLLASRSVGGGNDVVMPSGLSPTFGNSPCLASRWGTNYFRRLYDFHRASGFNLLEHDGSYPGDPCQSTNHPAHAGLADSRWNQWRMISDFYKWCRAEGIYLNVPDHYFLAGSSKTGMGYRESNWSLPREQQLIHTRQNIFDGTWEKLPSMGWMFVPLTEYQGGGAAATIEPLDQHLDHYENMLASNLALGVQACYRGPRLYDTERTRDMVKRWVTWFKAHRDILESDLIHGRRADSSDLDWMLHVNPKLKEKGLLAVFNPLSGPVEPKLRINLYYTGLTETVRVRPQGGEGFTVKLNRDYTVDVPITMAPQSMTWFTFE